MISTFESQLSNAVTTTLAIGGIGSPQAAVASAGTPFKTGPSVSSTVITCVTSVVLPQSSVAVHVLAKT